MNVLRSESEQHALRILQLVLDVDQETDRFLAVDDPVVIAECDVHHGCGDHLSIFDNGPFLDGVHAKDRALRRIDDGRGEQRTKYAAVGDGERAALQVIECETALTGLARALANGLSDLRTGSPR